jgi:twitching motility protein PilT
LKKGLISYEQALAGASNRDEFILRTKGVQTAAAQALEEMESKIMTTRATGALSPDILSKTGESEISRF